MRIKFFRATDSDNLKVNAQNVRSAGVSIFAVGVGNNYMEDELRVR